MNFLSIIKMLVPQFTAVLEGAKALMGNTDESNTNNETWNIGGDVHNLAAKGNVNVAEGGSNVGTVGGDVQGDVVFNSANGETDLSEATVWQWCNEHQFAGGDQSSMQRAGYTPRRLEAPSWAAIKDDIQQMASDGNMPQIIHNSGHGSEAGIRMADGKDMNYNMLADLFKGHRVELFVLMSCIYEDVALRLGMARWVIAFAEEIQDDHAVNAVFHLYKSLRAGVGVEGAYENMVAAVPEIEPFARLMGVRDEG